MRRAGKVKWFNDQKGYGFITPDDGSADLFIHHTNIATDMFRTLENGETVTFETAEGQKGQKAVRLFKEKSPEAGN